MPGKDRTLKNLKSNKHFIIKVADKGGNVVLWPIDMYTQEALRQLGNRTYYDKLPSDPMSIFKKKLDNLLLSAKSYGAINKRELDYMTVDHPVTSTFDLLPKVHKDINHPPGRPMMVGIESLCERLCTYIDFVLQPLVLNLLSHLRDFTSALQAFEGRRVPAETLSHAM